MPNIPCSQIYSERFEDVLPTRVMSAFVSKVGDLGHEDHDIPKGSKKEGPMQFYPELLWILWKWPFYYFPIMEKLTYSQIDVIPSHWCWLDNQWRIWIREA